MVTENEIAIQDPADVCKCMEMLVRNGYVVMISREENLWIINYVWSSREADRNDVVFMSKYEFEEHYMEIVRNDVE